MVLEEFERKGQGLMMALIQNGLARFFDCRHGNDRAVKSIQGLFEPAVFRHRNT